MATLVIAISGRTNHLNPLRYRLVKMDRLYLDYHRVRYSHHLALWSDLKNHRSTDPTRLIRVELYAPII